MSIDLNPIYIVNLVLCLAIVVIGCYTYRLNKGKVTLFISLAFAGFALIYLLTIVGLQKNADVPIIIISIAAYILIIFGLYKSWTDLRSQLEVLAAKNASLEEEIAGRKKVEEMHREAEEKYRIIFENALVGVIVVEEDLRISVANAEFRRIAGYNSADGTVRHFFDFLTAEDAARVRNFHDLRLADPGAAPASYEVRMLDGSGNLRDVNISVAMITGTKRCVVSALDITERKCLHELERQANEMYRTVFENVLTGMVIIEKDMTISLMNAEAELISGYAKGEVEGRLRVRDLLIGEDWQHLDRYCERLGEVQDSAPLRIDMRLRCKNGTVKDILASVNQIPGTGKILGSIMDISDRKRAESDIRASLKEKEVLIKEVHHRVKNNLQIVSSLLNLQSGYVIDGRDVEMFKDSQNRVRSMALIHEKLYRSRDLNHINLREYVESLIDHLNNSYSMTPDRIRLDVNIGDVFLDAEKGIPCGLIINELVSNSYKHAFPGDRSGEIQVSVGRLDQALAIIVNDNGVGLRQDFDIGKLNSLGMQLVATFTEQLDGKLTVASTQGQGTKFTIEFPS